MLASYKPGTVDRRVEGLCNLYARPLWFVTLECISQKSAGRPVHSLPLFIQNTEAFDSSCEEHASRNEGASVVQHISPLRCLIVAVAVSLSPAWVFITFPRQCGPKGMELIAMCERAGGGGPWANKDLTTRKMWLSGQMPKAKVLWIAIHLDS